MNQNDIETLSVGAVKESLIHSGFLEPLITEGDKQPSWDGFVNIYSEKSKTKDQLIGQMHVQVKGKLSKDFTKKEISYTSNKKDLKNFLYNGGVIFFVVYINEDNLQKKIYYSELAPIKLRAIIKTIKKDKKNIKLSEFPSIPDKKASIFLDCFHHCQKQTSFIKATLSSIEELEASGLLESITTTISGFRTEETNPFKLFFEKKDHYFYANIKGSVIPQPLDFMPSNIVLTRDISATIKVNNIQYYDRFTKIYSEETTTNKIGESFQIIVNNKNSNLLINYKESTFLRTLVKDLDFAIAVIDSCQIEFDDNILPIQYSTDDLVNFDLERQKSKLYYLKKAVQLFDTLGAFEDLDLSTLTHEEMFEINHLVTAFIDKEPVNNLKPNLPHVLTLKIGTFNFILIFKHVPNKENTYEIKDFFSEEIEAHATLDDGTEVVVSQYSFLSVENFVRTTNINFDVLLPSFQQLNNAEQKFGQANNLMLRILAAFDLSEGKKPNLLKTADQFAKWLLDTDDKFLRNNVRLLNWLQVKKRQRDLTTNEREQLIQISETSEREEEIVGAYLLLDYQEAARMHFSRLDKETQDAFKEYPIYRFFQ